MSRRMSTNLSDFKVVDNSVTLKTDTSEVTKNSVTNTVTTNKENFKTYKEKLSWQIQVLIIIVLFIISVSFIWICFYTANPYFTKELALGETEPAEDAEPDALKCMIWSLIIGFVFVVIVACIMACL
uniref:Uncharacterized protein n=1 Tax=viral metagenome TaxID=1070528 RepID=A0A6C0AG32_9ZZZZ